MVNLSGFMAMVFLWRGTRGTQLYKGVRSFGVIWPWISDPRSLRSWYIKGTDESTLVTDSSVPLMHHDPSDLGSLILIQITPKERTLNQFNFAFFGSILSHIAYWPKLFDGNVVNAIAKKILRMLYCQNQRSKGKKMD